MSALPREVAVVLADYAAERVPDRAVEKAAVKGSLAVLVERAPGRSVEVRIPPYAAVQVIAGTTHRRGRRRRWSRWTPHLAGTRCGAAVLGRRRGRGPVRASGERSDLGPWLPSDDG